MYEVAPDIAVSRSFGRNEMDPPLCGSTAISHNEFKISEPIEPQEASPMKQEMHVESREMLGVTAKLR